MTKAMKCAKEFAKWVAKHELQMDLSIYVDHARYNVDKEGNLVFDIEAEPTKYFEFTGDFMSVSTEGPLYDIINNYNDFIPGYDERKQEELNNLFAKYDKYYEMGNSWNFSLYNL